MAPVLQKPALAFFRGNLRRWEECNLHISSEAVVRGLNVFEGLKAYWQEDGSIGLLAVPRHWARMKRSAKLLHMPFDVTLDEFEDQCFQLTTALCRAEDDIWVRATLYGIEGHWGEGDVTDLVLTAYHQKKGAPDALRIGVTTWRRADDLALPARIKTSANYIIARLGKIEGRSRGYSEMIVLNSSGRVAEALGCCVLMVRDGTLVTPPASEGALESITIEICEALAATMGIPFQRRPIERTELCVADEVALVGTLAEITPVLSIDEYDLPAHRPMLDALTDRYFAAVRGAAPHPALDMTCRAVETAQRSGRLVGAA